MKLQSFFDNLTKDYHHIYFVKGDIYSQAVLTMSPRCDEKTGHIYTDQKCLQLPFMQENSDAYEHVLKLHEIGHFIYLPLDRKLLPNLGFDGNRFPNIPKEDVSLYLWHNIYDEVLAYRYGVSLYKYLLNEKLISPNTATNLCYEGREHNYKCVVCIDHYSRMFGELTAIANNTVDLYKDAELRQILTDQLVEQLNIPLEEDPIELFHKAAKEFELAVTN